VFYSNQPLPDDAVPLEDGVTNCYVNYHLRPFDYAIYTHALNLSKNTGIFDCSSITCASHFDAIGFNAVYKAYKRLEAAGSFEVKAKTDGKPTKYRVTPHQEYHDNYPQTCPNACQNQQVRKMRMEQQVRPLSKADPNRPLVIVS